MIFPVGTTVTCDTSNIQSLMTRTRDSKGKLRIGDDWNAIRIIALSQTNPLKAIAEFVENSIDARARRVTITRGREHGETYLAIRDDGDGVPRDSEGFPDFKYVATHICDSVKRQLKANGTAVGLQGEFGIGLLSFWTVGERLVMTSNSADHKPRQMVMSKGDPAYEVSLRRALFEEQGTEVRISPLLEGVRTLSGDKMQWYLAAELRDRIRASGVRITIIDRLARKQYEVEPRQFDGRLLHQLPAIATTFGDAYAELYMTGPAPESRVALYRGGTRVLDDVAAMPGLEHPPWTSGYLQGLLDVPFLTLTPGTRSGIVHDERFAAFVIGLRALEEHLSTLIAEQQRAEEERASEHLMRTIQRAFREAMLALPPEEYDWFDIRTHARRLGSNGGHTENALASSDQSEEATSGLIEPQQAEPPLPFFEHAGPLFAARVSPAACTVAINEARYFKALTRDRARRRVEKNLEFAWTIGEGAGELRGEHDQQVEFIAPASPGLVRLKVTVAQQATRCDAEALITVTESIVPSASMSIANARGLPSYRFERAAGELWRSRFDAEHNVIIVNSGHRDFVFVSRRQALKLRYLIRLYVKELVLRNFVGIAPDQLLERMIELSLYAEENL
jgi:Histidine kinase-, DNA gyrase B-, and HSP90-like ATPase